MIAKAEVRKRLALYENTIKEEIKKIENQIKKMDESCSTMEMKTIWKQSKEYTKLNTRWSTLTEILWGVQDIRCDEMFED